MERMEHIDPQTIGERYIDLEKILADKKIKLPKWLLRRLEKLIHLDEVNETIYKDREYFGLDFVYKFLEGHDPWDLGVTTRLVNPENIPQEGYPIMAGNHPLGGPDGLALMAAVGKVRQDIRFPVNDFLLYLPGPAPLFVPIDKVSRNRALASLEEAFAADNMLLYFPSGKCSRRHKGEIKDPEWKATFVKKAVKYKRDIVPFFVDARNRDRFYRLANLRTGLGLKVNIEMATLPAEMFAQRGKTMTITVGKPIAWQTFDRSHTAVEWAARLRDYVYRLKDNPEEQFEP